jgi:hypothetical protein
VPKERVRPQIQQRIPPKEEGDQQQEHQAFERETARPAKESAQFHHHRPLEMDERALASVVLLRHLKAVDHDLLDQPDGISPRRE